MSFKFFNNDLAFPRILTYKLNNLLSKTRGYIWTEKDSNDNVVNSFAEGEPSVSGDTSIQPIANGLRSHAEGGDTFSVGNYSHAEGYGSITQIGATFTWYENANHLTGSTASHGLKVNDIVMYEQGDTKLFRYVVEVNGTDVYINSALTSVLVTGATLYKCTGVAINNYTHSQGKNTIAIGDGSFAGGVSENSGRIISRGTGSIAFGYTTGEVQHDIFSSGYGSVALGFLSGDTGAFSINVTGNGSIGVGTGPINITGHGCAAFGNNLTCSGNYNILSGYINSGSNIGNSLIVGSNNNATGLTNSVVLGKYALATDTDLKFIIGNGTSGTNKQNCFTIDATGNTVSNGKISAVDGFFQTSDERKKNIISKDIDLDKAYSLIEKCSSIVYSLKTDETNKAQIGLIAQEVQEFFPEIITEDKDGFLNLDYSKLTVVILRVLKDLINRVSNLENK